MKTLTEVRRRFVVVVVVLIVYLPLFRLDSFRVAASDVGLVTNVVLEMYNSGQASRKWFLDKVIYCFTLNADLER